MSGRSSREAVLGFFEARGVELPTDEAGLLRFEYLDRGAVDSMGIVALVLELESEFGIRFGPEDMQSVDFRTIGGLVALTDRRRASA